MFGLSLTKLLVLGLAVFGAWHFFRWIERRSGTAVGIKMPPGRRAGPTSADPEEKPLDTSVDLIRDPQTGVWRPKRPGE